MKLLIHLHGATVQVWELISNFIPHLTEHVIIHPYPSRMWELTTLGAVVGHVTTHSKGRRPHECVVAWPTTASGAKPCSISIPARSFKSELKHAIRAVFEADFFHAINRCYQFQVGTIFPGEYVAMHAWWCHNGTYDTHVHEQWLSNEPISLVLRTWIICMYIKTTCNMTIKSEDVPRQSCRYI